MLRVRQLEIDVSVGARTPATTSSVIGDPVSRLDFVADRTGGPWDRLVRRGQIVGQRCPSGKTVLFIGAEIRSSRFGAHVGLP